MPNVVALYAWLSNQPKRVAEFVLQPDGNVTLTVSTHRKASWLRTTTTTASTS
jgi:hypothetical protein